MESPHCGLNLRIYAMVNGEELSGIEVVRAVKRKISAGADDELPEAGAGASGDVCDELLRSRQRHRRRRLRNCYGIAQKPLQQQELDFVNMKHRSKRSKTEVVSCFLPYVRIKG